MDMSEEKKMKMDGNLTQPASSSSAAQQDEPSNVITSDEEINVPTAAEKVALTSLILSRILTHTSTKDLINFRLVTKHPTWQEEVNKKLGHRVTIKFIASGNEYYVGKNSTKGKSLKDFVHYLTSTRPPPPRRIKFKSFAFIDGYLTAPSVRQFFTEYGSHVHRLLLRIHKYPNPEHASLTSFLATSVPNLTHLTLEQVPMKWNENIKKSTSLTSSDLDQPQILLPSIRVFRNKMKHSDKLSVNLMKEILRACNNLQVFKNFDLKLIDAFLEIHPNKVHIIKSVKLDGLQHHLNQNHDWKDRQFALLDGYVQNLEKFIKGGPKLTTLKIEGSFGFHQRLQDDWLQLLEICSDSLKKLSIKSRSNFPKPNKPLKNVTTLKISTIFVYFNEEGLEDTNNFTMGLDLDEEFPSLTRLEIEPWVLESNSEMEEYKEKMENEWSKMFSVECFRNTGICSKVTHLKLVGAQWSLLCEDECEEMLRFLSRVCPAVTHLELSLSNEFGSFQSICEWVYLTEITIELVANVNLDVPEDEDEEYDYYDHYYERDESCRSCRSEPREGMKHPVFQETLCGITNEESKELRTKPEKFPEILEKLKGRSHLCNLKSLRSLVLRLTESHESEKRAKHAFPISLVSAMCMEQLKNPHFEMEIIISTDAYESDFEEQNWYFQELLSEHVKITRT